MKLGDLIGKLSETEGFDVQVHVVADTEMDDGEVGIIGDISYDHRMRSVIITVSGADHAEEDDDAED